MPFVWCRSMYSVIGNVGRTAYVLTTKAAPQKRVIALDLDHTDSTQWQTIVPK